MLYPVFLLERTASFMVSSTCAGAILTIKEVANYLKVTGCTIYRLAAAKQTLALNVGGSWRFSQADIDEWIKLQSSSGQSGGRE